MRGQPELMQLRERPKDGKPGKLKSPNWYIYFIEGKVDRRKSTGYRIGTEDAEAQAYFHRWCLERKKPTVKEPEDMLVVFALKNYWDKYLQHRESKDSRTAGLWSEKRLLAEFGELYVAQIVQENIDEYVRKCCKERGESTGTVRRDLQHLKAAFNYQKKNRRLTWVPDFDMPKAPPPRSKTLSEKEVERLLASCISEHVKNTIILMLNTGQRPGAIANLKWFQVDFNPEEPIINFDKDGKEETKKIKRPVPMNDETYELLQDLFQRKNTEYVIEQVTKNKKGEVVKARAAGNIKKAFERACERAGLEGVSRYTLRHTFANTFVADEKTRSDIMGHTKTETTRTHYIKSNYNKQRNALQNLPKLRKNSASSENVVLINPLQTA